MNKTIGAFPDDVELAYSDTKWSARLLGTISVIQVSFAIRGYGVVRPCCQRTDYKKRPSFVCFQLERLTSSLEY